MLSSNEWTVCGWTNDVDPERCAALHCGQAFWFGLGVWFNSISSFKSRLSLQLFVCLFVFFSYSFQGIRSSLIKINASTFEVHLVYSFFFSSHGRVLNGNMHPSIHSSTTTFIRPLVHIYRERERERDISDTVEEGISRVVRDWSFSIMRCWQFLGFKVKSLSLEIHVFRSKYRRSSHIGIIQISTKFSIGFIHSAHPWYPVMFSFSFSFSWSGRRGCTVSQN